MKKETLRTPALPRPPMNDPETASTSPAGSRVTSGASSERKMMKSRTRMKRIDASWMFLPCLLDCSWLATLVATWPARWT